MKLEDVIKIGTRASQPAVGTVPIGTLYCVTDEGNKLERNNGAAWVTYAPTSGITELTGNVTAGPGGGSQVAIIPNDTITYAKMQNVSAADRLLGRGNGGGAGDVQEITLGTNLSMSGTTLNAAGGGNVLVTKLTLTDAQIRTANSVPLNIVAAPGAGITIIPIHAYFKGIRSGTAFSGDPIFNLRHNGVAIDLIVNASFIFNSAVAGTLFRSRIATDFSGSTSDDTTNKALQIRSSADVTLGAGCSLTISVAYYLADTN